MVDCAVLWRPAQEVMFWCSAVAPEGQGQVKRRRQGGWGAVDVVASPSGQQVAIKRAKSDMPHSEVVLEREMQNNLRICGSPSSYHVKFLGAHNIQGANALVFEAWHSNLFELYTSCHAASSEMRFAHHDEIVRHLMCVLTVARDAARGVLDLHMMGYIHGDLSAMNILIRHAGPGPERTAISGALCDFATMMPADLSGPCSSVTRQTLERAWLPPMSEPFQWYTRDAYGLGILLLVIALGAHPDALVCGQVVANLGLACVGGHGLEMQIAKGPWGRLSPRIREELHCLGHFALHSCVFAPWNTRSSVHEAVIWIEHTIKAISGAAAGF